MSYSKNFDLMKLLGEKALIFERCLCLSGLLQYLWQEVYTDNIWEGLF